MFWPTPKTLRNTSSEIKAFVRKVIFPNHSFPTFDTVFHCSVWKYVAKKNISFFFYIKLKEKKTTLKKKN